MDFTPNALEAEDPSPHKSHRKSVPQPRLSPAVTDNPDVAETESDFSEAGKVEDEEGARGREVAPEQIDIRLTESNSKF